MVSSDSLPNEPISLGITNANYVPWRQATTAVSDDNDADYNDFITQERAAVNRCRASTTEDSIAPSSIKDVPISLKRLLRRYGRLFWLLIAIFQLSLILLTVSIALGAATAHNAHVRGAKIATVILAIYGFTGLYCSAAIGGTVWKGRRHRTRLERKWAVLEEEKERRSVREKRREESQRRAIRERESRSRSRGRGKGKGRSAGNVALPLRARMGSMRPSFEELTPPSLGSEDGPDGDGKGGMAAGGLQRSSAERSAQESAVSAAPATNPATGPASAPGSAPPISELPARLRTSASASPISELPIRPHIQSSSPLISELPARARTPALAPTIPELPAFAALPSANEVENLNQPAHPSSLIETTSTDPRAGPSSPAEIHGPAPSARTSTWTHHLSLDPTWDSPPPDTTNPSVQALLEQQIIRNVSRASTPILFPAAETPKPSTDDAVADADANLHMHMQSSDTVVGSGGLPPADGLAVADAGGRLPRAELVVHPAFRAQVVRGSPVLDGAARDGGTEVRYPTTMQSAIAPHRDAGDATAPVGRAGRAVRRRRSAASVSEQSRENFLAGLDKDEYAESMTSSKKAAAREKSRERIGGWSISEAGAGGGWRGRRGKVGLSAEIERGIWGMKREEEGWGEDDGGKGGDSRDRMGMGRGIGRVFWIGERLGGWFKKKGRGRPAWEI
ncbi:hypothetical protein MMC21_006240 [Puttea exsequens]|nr:hypothetical protein [Puttea exsequens]